MHTPPVAACDQPVADGKTRRGLPQVIFATTLVSGLELFDFTVFGFFAAMIGDQFFPSTNPMTSLLLAVGTFGVGFFMRPLGATLIGAYADRVGRRAPLNATILLTSVRGPILSDCSWPRATHGQPPSGSALRSNLSLLQRIVDCNAKVSDGAFQVRCAARSSWAARRLFIK
jgi:MHS family proline/betaine transporter-like MFS transporter